MFFVPAVLCTRRAVVRPPPGALALVRRRARASCLVGRAGAGAVGLGGGTPAGSATPSGRARPANDRIASPIHARESTAESDAQNVFLGSARLASSFFLL